MAVTERFKDPASASYPGPGQYEVKPSLEQSIDLIHIVGGTFAKADYMGRESGLNALASKNNTTINISDDAESL